MNRIILYLSYGRGLHELEVCFSAWTARHQERSPTRIVICTDHPGSFAEAPVEIEHISTETWTSWGGPQNFNHRRKILALQHVLEKHRGAVVLVDGDTWWRTEPARVFANIGDGQTAMHIREGNIANIDGPNISELRQLVSKNSFHNLAGETLDIPVDCEMWNAGVIGMCEADLPLLDEVIHLTDQFTQKSDLHILEQFAFAYLLQTRTSLTESDDAVFHYWPPYLTRPFREKLPKIMSRASQMPSAEQARFLFQHRPRPTTTRRAKVVLKRIASACGMLRGQTRTNDW